MEPTTPSTASPGSAAGALLLLEGVRKDLRSSKELVQTIIHDISIAIPAGSMVAITGPSGSGKSTLLYMMGGLDRPSAGSVTFDGDVISTMAEEKLTRIRGAKVGFIYQFHFLLPEFSALENVMMPMQAGGAARKEARDRAAMLLERVGLADKLNSRPNQLSGGQQQRVAVARALANNPLMLLADEPTGSLDTAATEQIYELLAELHAAGQTIVYVTHDPGLAARADRQVNIVDGRIEADTVRGAGESAVSGQP